VNPGDRAWDVCTGAVASRAQRRPGGEPRRQRALAAALLADDQRSTKAGG